jgi:hypothetical protein
MIKVKVNNTTWNLPERITIKEWASIQKWDITDEAHWCYIINEIIHIPIEDLQAAEEESLQLFIGFLISAINKRTIGEQVDFNKLNFGEFVDLDCFIALGVEKHIDDILKVLKVDTPWSDVALATIDQYIKWRNTIYKQYSQLFGLQDKDFLDQEPSDEVYNPKEVSRGWYQVIVELAQEDILKIDAITEEPLQKVLTFLQIKKEKALAEAQKARKITNRK